MTEHTHDDPGQPAIRPGGIVHDLGQPGWPAMWVVRKEADSVDDYREDRGVDLLEYEKNIVVGATTEDTVWLVQYLTDGPLSNPQTRYPLPASRLGAQNVMAADHIADDHAPVRHPADQVVEDVLTALLTELKSSDDDDQTDVLDAARIVLDDASIVDVADERSDARLAEAIDSGEADAGGDWGSHPDPPAGPDDGGGEPGKYPETDGGDDADDQLDDDDDLGNFNPDGDDDG